uniref:Uncharacterized protein n=1 Tax=Anopheles atroparvus TaxID=41427 RepID=A0A182IPA9_ANOAO
MKYDEKRHLLTPSGIRAVGGRVRIAATAAGRLVVVVLVMLVMVRLVPFRGGVLRGKRSDDSTEIVSDHCVPQMKYGYNPNGRDADGLPDGKKKLLAGTEMDAHRYLDHMDRLSTALER